MNHPYGPWATLISAGQNPQLSAFWRRRMGMLAAVSETSPALSRRNVVWLVIAAVCLLVAPTFRAVPLAAQEEKAKSQDARNDARSPEPSLAATPKPPPAAPPRVPDQPSGVTIDPNFLPLPGYPSLEEPTFRKQIGINDEQEKKLREISAAFDAAQRKLAFTKEMTQLPPKDRDAKLQELQRKVEEDAKEFRHKIADVLTAPQWAEYQRRVRGRLGASLVTARKETSENWGVRLSQQQTEQLDRLEEKWVMEGEQCYRQFKDRLLGVLTPDQRQRLTAKLANANIAGPFVEVPEADGWRYDAVKVDTPFSYLYLSPDCASLAVYPDLRYERVRSQIGLDIEQLAKLRAILRTSETAIDKVFAHYEAKGPKKLSRDEEKSRRAEYRRKLKELGTSIIRQIDATLTPPQIAALNKIGRQEKEIEALIRPEREILSYLRATPEQEAKLRRTDEEYGTSGLESSLEKGAKAWPILTPDQRKKLEDLMDRNGW